MKIMLTDIHGIIIIMSWKLRVFPIFRSNYENNLDRNIDPRERPKFSRHYVADKCSVLSLLEPSNPAKSDDLAVNDASSVSSGRACVQYAVFTRPSVQELIMTNFPSLGTFLTSDDYGVSLPLSSRFNCKRLCSNFKQPIVIIKVSSRKYNHDR